MANHKSALKRIRQTESRRELNRYKHKTARNAVRNLHANTNKKEASNLLPGVISLIDKLIKNNIIHKNKAANLKSQLTKHVSALK